MLHCAVDCAISPTIFLHVGLYPILGVKDLFNQKEIGMEQSEAIKKFSQGFYVD